ncbi:MAG: outer membrane protein assembly factor BamE [Betaproteobacteria bacterium]|nr:outer membrane protein assembly factor BamE [Betaproteobacteria bacterium]
MKLPEGRELRIRNVKKYSGEELDGIFSRTLGKAKVDLDSFTKSERTTIMEGQVEPGMSKAAVLRALGYPPKHQTPSLSGNEWTYWRNRVTRFVVRFADDKVVSTR